MEIRRDILLIPRPCTMSGSTSSSLTNSGLLSVINYFNGIFHLFIAFILINCFILIKRGLAQPEEIDWTGERTHTEKSAGALVPDPDITSAGAMIIILPLPTVTIILLIADRR